MKNSCPHYIKRRKEILSKNYPLIIGRIVFPTLPHDVKAKASLVRCRKCADATRLCPMLCCCMDCATFGCLAHLRNHFDAKQHDFALSINEGDFFCAHCNDFIFDHRMEKLRNHFENRSRRILGLSLHDTWNIGYSEIQILRRHAPLIYRLGVNSTRGLRGLVNMGNSCFMNCIIQTLIHIPMLRDYFLTDQHNCIFLRQHLKQQHQQLKSTRSSSGSSNSKSNTNINSCLMCEMSNLFQEFYRGEVAPFVPHRMMHLVWAHAEHLAGYAQHDAHEFFISALNILHKHSESRSVHANSNGCMCIIDRLFTGQLQSDLTCNRCGHLSTTVEPYWDISLQLNYANSSGLQKSSTTAPISSCNGTSSNYNVTSSSHNGTSSSHNGTSSSHNGTSSSHNGTSSGHNGTSSSEKENSRASDASASGAGAEENLPTAATRGVSPASSTTSSGVTSLNGEISLEECLQNFVKREKMEMASGIRCGKCGTYEESVKQLTLRKLPMVVCFHLKRFEHTPAAKKSRKKIKGPVKFSEFIDLTPYTTAYRDSCIRERIFEDKKQECQQQQIKQHPYPTRRQQQYSQSQEQIQRKLRPQSLSPTKKGSLGSQKFGLFTAPSLRSPVADASTVRSTGVPSSPRKNGCSPITAAKKKILALNSTLNEGSLKSDRSSTISSVPRRSSSAVAAKRSRMSQTLSPNAPAMPPKAAHRRTSAVAMPIESQSVAELSPSNQKTSSMRHLTRLTNRYALMAVVNHEGTTDSGHYTCHVRHQYCNWYMCNDDIINREQLDQVLESEGYLLFYCKMFLDYD